MQMLPYVFKNEEKRTLFFKIKYQMTVRRCSDSLKIMENQVFDALALYNFKTPQQTSWIS